MLSLSKLVNFNTLLLQCRNPRCTRRPCTYRVISTLLCQMRACVDRRGAVMKKVRQADSNTVMAINTFAYYLLSEGDEDENEEDEELTYGNCIKH